MSYSRITKLFHNFFTTSKDVANCECVFLFHCVSLSISDCTSPCPCLSFSSLLTRRMTLYFLQPIFLLSSACPTRLSHFSINEKAGLQDFSNKLMCWTIRLTCSVWSSTQLIITSYVCIYIYIYIYIWWVLHMYNCNQVKLVIHLHIWDHNIFQPSASQTKWSFTKPISPLFKNTCNFFFFWVYFSIGSYFF